MWCTEKNLTITKLFLNINKFNFFKFGTQHFIFPKKYSLLIRITLKIVEF